MAGLHVYVHAPFCARRCSYCDFAIAVRRVPPAAQFVDALRSELQVRVCTGMGSAMETLYIGGGTPSHFPPAALAEIVALLRGRFGIAADAEVTLEANPEDVTLENAVAWRQAGINRLSLGVQSFDDATLRWMHRVHDSRQAVAAARLIAEAGFDNWSLDLIFGLPGAVVRDWHADLERALELEPPHLSLYGLTVEPHTTLYHWQARGATPAPEEDAYASEFLEAHQLLEAVGYCHYEVSNYARSGYESRHNLAYWTRRPYLGLGPSAHSFDGRRRRWNLRYYEAWRRALAAGVDPVDGEEQLAPEQAHLEELYLSLRTLRGVLLRSEDCRIAEEFARRGWLERKGERWLATPRGWLLLDRLVLSLTEAASSY